MLLRSDQRPKQNHEDVLLPAHLQELYLSVKDLGLILSQKTYSPIAYPVSKQLSALLRHGHLPREEDEAIELWRLKDCLRNEFENSQHWSGEMWKSTLAGGGGNKKRFQYCTDDVMMINFTESGHPVFRGSSAFERQFVYTFLW